MKLRLSIAIALAVSYASGAPPKRDVADAAMRGDKASVRSLVLQKANVNAPDA